MSEDPVLFSVWSQVKPGCSKLALAELAQSRGVRPASLLSEVNASASGALSILVASGVTWEVAQGFTSQPPAWTGDVAIYQEGYGPEIGRLDFCEVHELHYAGCIGCHVCTGFYR